MNRTIRVLLADDEPVILRGLKKLISWSTLGLDIVGEARDGIELRAMIESCKPDLIISDISMPGYSGIDIIREIHQSGRTIKVIFISAYQEFAYAREAVQYGALDYLVKPVNTGQLEQVVTRAATLIRQESQEERNKEMLRTYERRNLSVTVEEQLEQLTDGNKAAAVTLARMGNTAITRYASICVIETDEYSDQPSRWEERERKLVEFALSNIIKETVDERGNGYVFRKGERFSVLLQHEQLAEPQQWMEDLHHKINSFLKLQVTIGIGEPVGGVEEAAESYQSALKALRFRYFAGSNRVISYTEEQAAVSLQAAVLPGIQSVQSGITEALKSLDKELLTALTAELLDNVSLLSGGSRNQAVSHVYNAIIQLEADMADFGVDAGLMNQGGKPLLETLADAPAFSTLRQEFAAVLLRMLEQLGCRAAGKEMPQLAQVKSYVEEHYAENITLESIAALVYMNPYYFSSFFKKHTGQNFKNYLTEVRMDHARRLLLQSDLMVYEIADRVGYNNARHFSDMFKKQFGKLPQEYKQSVKH
ncbi:response regulator [Paenibacillus sp. MMS20-IR301]|uniref:response regulator n=1 Tax=Paenibacillus sp. MMS20-IR301 TaxID=2895946 RepID=UPI0028E81E72|nr:response regulator [Paenibacillus sp. MMS20-IR301]WNS44894.1 response regulator [Paenibacillus sp. MMS20-IR301]